MASRQFRFIASLASILKNTSMPSSHATSKEPGETRLVAPPGRPLSVDRATAALRIPGGSRPGSAPAPVARPPLGVGRARAGA